MDSEIMNPPAGGIDDRGGRVAPAKTTGRGVALPASLAAGA